MSKTWPSWRAAEATSPRRCKVSDACRGLRKSSTAADNQAGRVMIKMTNSGSEGAEVGEQHPVAEQQQQETGGDQAAP